jgi:hypothetical protein
VHTDDVASHTGDDDEAEGRRETIGGSGGCDTDNDARYETERAGF